jgi:hypothetical protein
MYLEVDKNDIRKYIDNRLRNYTDRKTFLIPTNYSKTQHMQIKRNANDIQQNITSGTIAFILILVITVVAIISSLSSSQAQIISNNNSGNSNIEIEILQADSKPYGLTYGEWTARWWQWAYSIPKDVNPAYDDTGRYCTQGQSGPVWFLTGTYGHPVDRYCTIPSGKAILFPILNSECSFAEFPNLKNEKELRQCSKEMEDTVNYLEAKVNDIDIKDSNKYRIQSPLFNFTLPKNNIVKLPPQTTTQAVSDGNWVFLKPFAIGKYVIYFKGGLKNINATTSAETNSSNYAFAGPYGWDYPVTYHLTITNNN